MRINDWISQNCRFAQEQAMRIHMSGTPITSIRPVSNYQDIDFKPDGFWYSCGSEWANWIKTEMPEWEGKYLYEVLLNNANMLYLRNEANMSLFEKKYGATRHSVGGFVVSGERMIDWGKVALDYDGIEINPYQFHSRSSRMWYYPWDVASGCVWNTDKIQLKPISDKPEDQTRIIVPQQKTPETAEWNWMANPKAVKPQENESEVQAAERAHNLAISTNHPVTLVLDGGSVNISPSDLMFFHRGTVKGNWVYNNCKFAQQKNLEFYKPHEYLPTSNLDQMRQYEENLENGQEQFEQPQDEFNEAPTDEYVFHGTTREALVNIMQNDLQPSVGAFVENAYGEYAEQGIELEEILYLTERGELNKALSAIVFQIGALKQYPWAFDSVTPKDIVEHGVLILVKKDSDMYKADERGMSGNILENDKVESPIGVETEDVWTKESQAPSAIITGPHLLQVLMEYDPQLYQRLPKPKKYFAWAHNNCKFAQRNLEKTCY
jgi:hypothetical protein